MTTPRPQDTDPLRARGTDREPWDHAYQTGPDTDNVCLTCGWVGSYAHSEEFYRKWVWPAQRRPRFAGWSSEPRGLRALVAWVRRLLP